MSSYELVIKPRTGWRVIDFREVSRYRELFAFLVWRDIKVRYRQTLLGGLWAVLQPLLAMIVFTIIFHRLAGIGTDGAPYPLFAFAGLAPWTFFSASVTQSSNSLIGNQNLVSKIYFPRLFIPLGAVSALLMDLLLSLGIFSVLLIWYHWRLTAAIFFLPIFVVAAFLAAGGVGLVLSALNVNFRDVKYAVPFLIQMGLFVTPVIYPARYVPKRWTWILAINPMSGVVLGFRRCLLGAGESWTLIVSSLAVCVLLFMVGLFVFGRMERRFADII
jgi:lipopolysaccharide transport system permease protein